jgi:hypothetical protein
MNRVLPRSSGGERNHQQDGLVAGSRRNKHENSFFRPRVALQVTTIQSYYWLQSSQWSLSQVLISLAVIG